MSGSTSVLLNVLAVIAVALLVRLAVQHRERISFASVLIFVGVLVSVLGLSLELALTSELILTLLLPPIIFQGTTTLDVRRLWRNTGLIAVLTLVGLPVAIVLLGAIGTVAFDFSVLIALLFAAIILPTDPAAVLSLFEEFEVSERLAVTIEGESLFNDGVAIVIFSTLIGAFEAAETIEALASVEGLFGIAGDVVIFGGDGLALGVVLGYLAHALMRQLEDEMSILLLTVLVAYGSFLLAEQYLGLSGILAVVGAGLLMGPTGKPTTR